MCADNLRFRFRVSRHPRETEKKIGILLVDHGCRHEKSTCWQHSGYTLKLLQWHLIPTDLSEDFKLQKLSASSLHHPRAVCLQIKQLTVSYQVTTGLNKQSSASPAHFLETCIVLALTRIHPPVHTLILFPSYKPVQLVVPVHSKSITKQKRVNQTSWMQRVELTRPGAPFMIRKKFKTTIIEHENLLLS